MSVAQTSARSVCFFFDHILTVSPRAYKRAHNHAPTLHHAYLEHRCWLMASRKTSCAVSRSQRSSGRRLLLELYFCFAICSRKRTKCVKGSVWTLGCRRHRRREKHTGALTFLPRKKLLLTSLFQCVFIGQTVIYKRPGKTCRAAAVYFEPNVIYYL